MRVRTSPFCLTHPSPFMMMREGKTRVLQPRWEGMAMFRTKLSSRTPLVIMPIGPMTVQAAQAKA